MTADRPFWLTGLTLADGAHTDLLVADGKIAAIGAASGEAPRTDMAGRICLPSFVEGHVHLDKTFLGCPWQPHLPGGSVADRIRLEKTVRARLDVPVEVRGALLVEQELRFGTGFMRSHVDIDADSGLANFEAVAAIRDRFREQVAIQIVAFPQSGILASPGTDRLLEQALLAGADAIGGLDPAGIDRDPAGHLDIVFELAARHAKDVDIHLHETGPLGVFELELICDRTTRLGLGGRVTVSHAYCLGDIVGDTLNRIGDRLATAGVAIMTSAPERSMPPLKELAALGVTVFAGNDNIRDAWAPYGTGDMLERASIAARQQDFRSDDDLCTALDLIGSNAARALRLEGYGLAVGHAADLVLIRAETVAEAVATAPTDRIVFNRGKRLSGT